MVGIVDTTTLAILHSGFDLADGCPPILLLLLAVTYISGLFGWAMQHFIPHDVEVLASRNDYFQKLMKFVVEAWPTCDKCLHSAFGPSSQLPSSNSEHRKVILALELEAWAPPKNQTARALTIGATRESQRISSLGYVHVEPDMADANRIMASLCRANTVCFPRQIVKSWLANRASAESYFTNLEQAVNQVPDRHQHHEFCVRPSSAIRFTAAAEHVAG